MPLVLAVANLKGGVGKSTVALNLAATLHHAKHRVLLVDTDQQGTCRSWAAVASEAERDGPPVVAVDGRSLRRDLDRVSERFEVVVLDTSPRLGAEVRAAMIVADLVLLPVVPGAADVWALRETLAVMEEARGLRPELRAGVVLNRASRTTLTGVTRTALEELEVPVLGALGDRVAFGEAIAQGLGVVTYAPASKAAGEVEELMRAVLKAVDQGKKRWAPTRKAS